MAQDLCADTSVPITRTKSEDHASAIGRILVVAPPAVVNARAWDFIDAEKHRVYSRVRVACGAANAAHYPSAFN